MKLIGLLIVLAFAVVASAQSSVGTFNPTAIQSLQGTPTTKSAQPRPAKDDAAIIADLRRIIAYQARQIAALKQQIQGGSQSPRLSATMPTAPQADVLLQQIQRTPVSDAVNAGEMCVGMSMATAKEVARQWVSFEKVGESEGGIVIYDGRMQGGRKCTVRFRDGIVASYATY